MIRPVGISPDDASWSHLTSQQMLEKFHADGIAGVPKAVAAKILDEASKSTSPDAQLEAIFQQSAAWIHIDQFKRSDENMPEQRKGALLDMLERRYGDSWKAMSTQLDAQVAASNRVTNLRLNGIPGLTPSESDDLIVKAIEHYSPDYEKILSVALKSAKK